MADAATESGGSRSFWKTSASDEKQTLVYMPVEGGAKIPLNSGRGSTSNGNERGFRTHKLNGKRERTRKKEDKRQDYSGSECSGVYHQEMSATRTNFLDSGDFHPTAKVFSEPKRAKSLIGLKDLCPDDKRRIANLVEELARVSEEKELSVQRLKAEHQSFEQKIQQLEKQNVMIAQEREIRMDAEKLISWESRAVLIKRYDCEEHSGLQHQYKECQELLGLYQHYLSLQQVKLNQSIAQLRQDPAVNKELSREEAAGSASPHPSDGSLHDGSYLGFAAAARPRGPRIRERCGDNKPASSPENGPLRREKGPAREFHQGCHGCCCQGRCYGAPQRRCDEGPCWSGPGDQCNHHDCARLHVAHSGIPEAHDTLTMPVLGHKDWEEKRHQVFLQKMQLEVERERLQLRLAEQEQRLGRQNQPLQQSRLQSSRDQQADCGRSYSANGGLQMEASIQHQLPTRNKPDGHPVAAVGQSSPLEKRSQAEPAPADHEALMGSRKDMGASPLKSPENSNKAAPASGSQEPPLSSMEFSVVELLDIMSPVTAPKPTRGRPQLSRACMLNTPRPGDRAVLAPTWSRHRQDQEESQILEDIFFIC